jgi:hypothetical protein
MAAAGWGAANEFARWQRKHVKTCFNTFPLSAIEFIRWCAPTKMSHIQFNSFAKIRVT